MNSHTSVKTLPSLVVGNKYDVRGLMNGRGVSTWYTGHRELVFGSSLMFNKNAFQSKVHHPHNTEIAKTFRWIFLSFKINFLTFTLNDIDLQVTLTFGQVLLEYKHVV